MKISKSSHKVLLFNLFYEKGRNPYNGQEGLVAKEFPLEKLLDAGTAKKKVMPEVEKLNDTEQRITFKEGEVEFTPSEIVVLKELFDGKKNWSVDDAEIVKELKDIFYPSIPVNS